MQVRLGGIQLAVLVGSRSCDARPLLVPSNPHAAADATVRDCAGADVRWREAHQQQQQLLNSARDKGSKEEAEEEEHRMTAKPTAADLTAAE